MSVKLWIHILLYCFTAQTWCLHTPFMSSSIDDIPAKKGFGSKLRNITPIRNIERNDASSKVILEQNIQRAIDQCSGLREAMILYEDISSYENKLKTMNIIEQASLSKNYAEKMEKKLIKAKELNWYPESIRLKLQEITWDSTAAIRHKRHQLQSNQVPKVIVNHMLNISKFALHLDQPIDLRKYTPSILDVGCGTGVVFEYLMKQLKADGNYFNDDTEWLQNVTKTWYGVDISPEMTKICSSAFPGATFSTINFMEYEPKLLFSTVVMNECLHNFPNIYEVLDKAVNMLDSESGRIIISHPKGFDHVLMQCNANKWLAPSLLPIADELQKFAAAIGLELLVNPDSRSPSYLAVLQKRNEK